MPAHSVATATDVTAVPAPPPPGPPSALPPKSPWVPSPVLPTPHPSLMVDGAPAISAATCTFTFTGTPPQPPDQVVLNAKSTALRCDGVGVLVDGDFFTSPLGNTLKVTSTRGLRTA
jgi:hypothetical protein